MSVRTTELAQEQSRRLSLYWSGERAATSRQWRDARALAEIALDDGGDTDVTELFVVSWSSIGGTDVIG